MKSTRRIDGRIAALVLVAFALALVGWHTHSRAQTTREDAAEAGPKAGQTCTVYLRGDATGVGFRDRVPDLANLIQRTGKVVSVDSKWLVLKEGDKTYRIPQSSIAVIEDKSRRGKFE